jgi:hypothetical protein
VAVGGLLQRKHDRVGGRRSSTCANRTVLVSRWRGVVSGSCRAASTASDQSWARAARTQADVGFPSIRSATWASCQPPHPAEPCRAGLKLTGPRSALGDGSKVRVGRETRSEPNAPREWPRNPAGVLRPLELFGLSVETSEEMPWRRSRFPSRCKQPSRSPTPVGAECPVAGGQRRWRRVTMRGWLGGHGRRLLSCADVRRA